MNVSLVMDRGAQALENVATLAGNLNKVVEDFGQATGGKRLADSVGALASVVEGIEAGDGLLHSLIYDEYEGGGVGSIERSLVTLEGILNEVARGDGVASGSARVAGALASAGACSSITGSVVTSLSPPPVPVSPAAAVSWAAAVWAPSKIAVPKMQARMILLLIPAVVIPR